MESLLIFLRDIPFFGNRFKEINMNYGHSIYDSLLQLILAV